MTALGIWLAAHAVELLGTLAVTCAVTIPSILVAGKEKPLSDEGRLPFWWRVWGRVAFTTFKNVGTVWGFELKLPGAAQPEERVNSPLAALPPSAPVTTPVPGSTTVP